MIEGIGDIGLKPIGYIKTQYKEVGDLPRQAYLNKDTRGYLIIEEEYIGGTYGLKVGQSIDIIFYFHKSDKEPIKVKSRKTGNTVGVFATRSPNRPNKLGISQVEIVEIRENKIGIKGIDMLDGTPIIDIKPSLDNK